MQTRHVLHATDDARSPILRRKSQGSHLFQTGLVGCHSKDPQVGMDAIVSTRPNITESQKQVLVRDKNDKI